MSTAHVMLSMDQLRSIVLTTQGLPQLMQTLKENGCTMTDQKMAEMLHFIVAYIDIQLQSSHIPVLSKRELCQMLEYLSPSPSAPDVRPRPGKGFVAVMRPLLRCMGANDPMVAAFAANKRQYKYVTWTDEGRQKLSEALRWHQEHPLINFDEDDEDFEDEKRSQSKPSSMPASSSSSGGTPSAVGRAGKKFPVRPLRGGFAPKYDVLFSRSLWSYFIRIFMPMCDPVSLQNGIKLDLLRGQLNLRGRYAVVASLPPWCTQNETLTDLEVVQSLPASASGDFALDISLPFDVDRTARKEVHVTDIGVVVALKRVKEDLPHNHLEFKVHTFDTGMPPMIAQSSSV
jgi:hypothetical protein